MATCLFRPSYVSFETVLFREGLIVRASPCIHVASYLSRQLDCGGRTIRFHKVRGDLFTKSYGLDPSMAYPMASMERAFSDTLRRDRNFHFNYLSRLDWEVVFSELHLYRNRRLYLQVDSIHSLQYWNRPRSRDSRVRVDSLDERL